jgi:hypothetical protein
LPTPARNVQTTPAIVAVISLESSILA